MNKTLLERFSTALNRKGFPRGGFSDSESVLVKEAKAERSRRLEELRDLEALSFSLGLAAGPRWRGRKPTHAERPLVNRVDQCAVDKHLLGCPNALPNATIEGK